MEFNNPQNLINTLAYAYYEDKNIELILSCVTEDVEWIGTERNETASGKEELKKMLEEDFDFLHNPICVQFEEHKVQMIGNEGAIFTLIGKKNETTAADISFSVRGTVYCVKTQQGWLISNIHLSTPNSEIEKESLKNALDEEREKQKALLDNVPGGIAMYRVKKDGRIATDYVSDGLARICGYEDSKDIMKVMEYDSRKLVLPEDFPRIEEACRESLEKGVPTSVNYRVYGKDGNQLHITLDSVVIKNAKLGEDDVAVFYAVQTHMSDEKEKEIQEEKARLKLMNYVPGGIGIYDIYGGIAKLQYLNEAYMTMMEFKQEDRAQYYGHDILSVVYPQDRHILDEMLEEISRGKRLTNVIFRVKNGSGKWKWINLVMRVVEEKNKHYTGYANLYNFDNVIKSKQEMEVAHKKEETLLSSIPGGIAIYRLKKNGKIAAEYVSEPLAKMCGYEVGEFFEYLKDDAMINLVPEDIPQVSAAVEKCLEDQHNISVIYRIYKKDRTTIMIRLDANVIEAEKIADDEIAVFYAVHTIVSEESKRIMEEQKSLSLLLNSVPAGIGIYVVENGLLNQEYMNDAFFEILHTTREERNKISSKSAIAYVHPDDHSIIQNSINELMEGASCIRVEYRVLNGFGGYTWFHVAASVTERKEGYIKFFIAFSDCTDSKEQELLLLQNERAVELAQTQGDFAIWTYNIDRRIILQQIRSTDKGSMGYRIRLEHVPECFIESNAVHPDDIEKFLQAYKDLDDGKEMVDITYRLIDKRTGEFEWLRMFYQRMESTDKNERMAVGFSMNVDKDQKTIERYRVEQSLREHINENVLMYMEYNLTKGSFESDGKMTGPYLQPDLEKLSIYEYMTYLSQTVDEDYVKKVSEKMSSDNLKKAFEAGETRVSVEFRGKTEPDSASTWYGVDASLVKRPDTGDIMAFITVENLDKEKNRQLAIENSLSDGVESVAIIHIADQKIRIILEEGTPVLPEHEKYTIYDDNFVNRSSMVVIPEERKFGYEAALFSTVIKELDMQDIYQYAVTTKKDGGENKRQLFRFRYLDDRKTNIVMSISDVTSVYLEDQEKKKQLEAALNEAHKASHAKADFYSRMSHDMRTPMNGILGMANLSEDETDSAILKENIGKIKESGEYLLSLINDTLDIQRIESGKMKLEPSIVSTTDMVRNIIEMISITANAKGVNLNFDNGNTELNWYVRADALRLKQIFINLLSNAIKFTPTGGNVDFEFKLLSREGMISHNVVYVRDNGVGMSKEFLENGIFKPFSQESNAVSATYAGSGLGLSIAKSLVELMGGKIEVESELGVGTTFSVYLNFERVNEDEAKAIIQSEKKQSKNTLVMLRGKRILLAEDHPLNAEIAKKLLQKAGCEVTWTENGQEAVSCFAEAQPETFDVILMDIRMPVMDGLEAARQIRALAKEDAASVPIIAMTANAYEDDVKECIAAGMDAHLGKPIEPKVLYDTISMYLH